MNSLQEVLTSWGSSSTWSSWTPGQTAALWMSTNDASRAEEGREAGSYRIGQTGYSGKQVRQVALVVAWTRIWMARRISPTCRAVGGLVLELCPCQVDDGLLHRPVGPLVRGGPVGDAGLTGRKIIVDTYGGAVPHGGGAFSGKDPTKVDRSAAYYARFIAKNVVAAGLARRALVEIAYAIGRAGPVSLRVDTYGTGTVSDEQLAALIATHFDARPQSIIAELDLQRPIYAQTAAYGHFGRPEFPWEQTPKAEALKTGAGQ